ncbi:MAG: GcrA cell cycle regulator [Hyphomicrobiaceae bacterium]|nr:GcrA cell cycle regulator [Hyphomicrobiaceae bacterium]
MAWTDDRVELLKKLWAEGLSASQIANRLGGVTRNAVIGKVHRLGLSGRTTTSRAKAPRTRRRPAHAQNRTARPQLRSHGNLALKPAYDPDVEEEVELVPAPIQELVIPVEERASILTLDETKCRWPIGDPGDEDFHFCGRRCDVGVPYCEFHCGIAYQPAQSRRKTTRA